jgi:hypothetical protein
MAQLFLARTLHSEFVANRTGNADKGEQAIQEYKKFWLIILMTRVHLRQSPTFWKILGAGRMASLGNRPRQ